MRKRASTMEFNIIGRPLAFAKAISLFSATTLLYTYLAFGLSILTTAWRKPEELIGMADEYTAVLTGGLSLKGGLFKSKKKKKGKRKREEAEAAARAQAALVEEEPNLGVPVDDTEVTTSESDNASKKGGGADMEERATEDVNDMLTPAQRRFKDKQLQREGRQIRNMVEKTHRERVEDFNALLASMTEHNDIPRCSAAGNG